jgi:putative ABC transport system permease protein
MRSELAALPGVLAVGIGSPPLRTSVMGFDVQAEGKSLQVGETMPHAEYRAASPEYFRAAGIPLLKGREFAATDLPGTDPVVIVNQRFAQVTFGDRNPIGRLLRSGDDASPNGELEIIGVAGNVVQARVEDGVLPAVYVPHTQLFAPLNVLVATRRDPQELARELRRSVAEAGLWSAPLLGLSSMETRIGKSLSAPRFQLLLIGAFAGAAVLLAAIGLYGTLAFTVRSRTREIGIRIAMGASRRQIFDLVLRQGGSVLALGLAIGLVGALGLTRLLRGFLYRVSPIDPVGFVGAMAIVVIAVLLAALRPAGRAARVDPMASMRAGN